MPLDSISDSTFRNTPNFVDIDSYRIIPWKELTPTASLLMSQPKKYDNIYPTDCRSIAMKQLKTLNNIYNLDILTSIEHEFSLLDKNEKPISNPGCYHLDRIRKYSEFFAKVTDLGINL